MKLRLSVIALLGFAAPLLAMDVPKKDTFLLTVHNKTDKPLLVALYEVKKGWASTLSAGVIPNHAYLVDKRVLRVKAGQTAEKAMKHYEPESYFVTTEAGPTLSSYSDMIAEREAHKSFPESEELKYLRAKASLQEIVGDHVIMTVTAQGKHFEQEHYTPYFSLKIENKTNDPYYARILSQGTTTSARGWLGGTTEKITFEPLSPLYKIEPQSTVEAAGLPKRSTTAGTKEELVFAIALNQGDFDDSQKMKTVSHLITKDLVTMTINPTKAPRQGGVRLLSDKPDLSTAEGRLKATGIEITEN